MPSAPCHCEERSDAAIPGKRHTLGGLPRRYAPRNDSQDGVDGTLGQNENCGHDTILADMTLYRRLWDDTGGQ
jgi:hypothetical protein